jgi:K+-transporting ATPase ATPase B chain
MDKTTPKLLDQKILGQAIWSSVQKLDPRLQLKNPVMFAVYLGSIFTTVLWIKSLSTPGSESSMFNLSIAVWLWFTVLFANFAEAIAEGHGKAQAASLKKSRTTVTAHRITSKTDQRPQAVAATELKIGELVIVRAGETIPVDGEIIEGVASVDESAVTGESAPVVRESGGDRSSVTGGTRVISDWLIIEVKTLPGDSFLDRMIAMVEGAKRQKTPNEIALAILLAALTLIFLLVVATLLPYSIFSVKISGQGAAISLTVLVALFVCLAPTTIGALLSAIGIAGMNRLSQARVVAMSGRLWKRPATWTYCCSTRPVRSLWGIVRPPASFRRKESKTANSRRLLIWPQWPMKPQKVAVSRYWPRSSLVCEVVNSNK